MQPPSPQKNHWTYDFFKANPPRSLNLWFLKTNPQDHWAYGFLRQSPNIIGLMVS